MPGCLRTYSCSLHHHGRTPGIGRLVHLFPSSGRRAHRPSSSGHPVHLFPSSGHWTRRPSSSGHSVHLFPSSGHWTRRPSSSGRSVHLFPSSGSWTRRHSSSGRSIRASGPLQSWLQFLSPPAHWLRFMDSLCISFSSPRVILSSSSGVRLFFRSNIAPCPGRTEPSPIGMDRAGAARRQTAARAIRAIFPEIIVCFILNQPSIFLMLP
ncbi:MAG: hypothetical protein CG446_1310, partial [Methanosaeta sp. ASO1]